MTTMLRPKKKAAANMKSIALALRRVRAGDLQLPPDEYRWFLVSFLQTRGVNVSPRPRPWTGPLLDDLHAGQAETVAEALGEVLKQAGRLTQDKTISEAFKKACQIAEGALIELSGDTELLLTYLKENPAAREGGKK